MAIDYAPIMYFSSAKQEKRFPIWEALLRQNLSQRR